MSDPNRPPMTGVSEAQLEAIRSRLPQEAEMAAPGPAAETLFVRRYRFFANQVPDWAVVRSRSISLVNRPPLQRITLQAQDNPARLLKLDVYETESQKAAREVLVQALAGFQLLPELKSEEQIGDVAFLIPDDRGVIFTRGNLVFVVLSAGPQPVQASEIAAQLDQALRQKPEPDRSKTATMTLKASQPEEPEASLAMRSLDLGAAPEEEQMLKLFSRGGSFYLDEGGELAFQPAGDQEPQVEGFAVGEDGSVGRLEVTVEPADPDPDE